MNTRTNRHGRVIRLVQDSRKYYSNLRGFSMVELLVVVAIVSMLTVVALPGFRSVFIGNNLSRGGQMVGDVIAMARQEAVSKNREVRVCFYHFSGGTTPGWRGMQIFRIDPTSTGSSTTNAVTKVMYLPEGIIVSTLSSGTTSLSPLLGADTSFSVSNVVVPGLGTSDATAGFRFKADGAVYGSQVTTQNNYITLQNNHDLKTPLSDYYTVQLDPVAGKIFVYRP